MIVNDKIISRKIHKETVLLNKENGDYFSLNEIGTEIYDYICNKMETKEIVDLLSNKYETERNNLENDVLSLISELQKKNILINQNKNDPV
jgi:hypothetical protein